MLHRKVVEPKMGEIYTLIPALEDLTIGNSRRPVKAGIQIKRTELTKIYYGVFLKFKTFHL